MFCVFRLGEFAFRHIFLCFLICGHVCSDASATNHSFNSRKISMDLNEFMEKIFVPLSIQTRIDI